MKYESGSGHRTKKSESKKNLKINRDALNAVRLILCALILGITMLLKTFFPSVTTAASEFLLPLMEQDFDYKGAITAIGGTLTGDKNITEVLGDLYIKAFDGGGSTINVSAEEGDLEALNIVTAGDFLEDSVERFKTKRAAAAETLEEAAEEVAAEAEAPAEANTQVATFLANQTEFSDYDPPWNVSYDMPELGIDYTVPATGAISSAFGYRLHPLENTVKFHYGTDIAANMGTGIAAFATGTVITANESAAAGLYIIIQHENGVRTKYAHCNALYVQEGDTVSKGDIIAAVGDTGDVTGAHLHFELIVDGNNINPEYYLIFV